MTANTDLDLRGTVFQLAGTYKAWLETFTTPASQRLYHSPGRYKRLDGVIVADNFWHLRDGPLHASINLTETLQNVHDLDLMEKYEKDVYKTHSAHWSWSSPINFPHWNEYCKDWTSIISTGVLSDVNNLEYGSAGISIAYNCKSRLALLCIQQAWYPED